MSTGEDYRLSRLDEMLKSSYDEGWDAGYTAGQVGMQKTVATAEAVTRIQIINLLEDECDCDVDFRCYAHQFIDLIKGENK